MGSVDCWPLATSTTSSWRSPRRRWRPRAAAAAGASFTGREVSRRPRPPFRGKELGDRAAEAALVGTRVGSRMARGERGGDFAARSPRPWASQLLVRRLTNT